MDLWTTIGVIAATFSLLGILGALLTNDVKYPFIFGFNTLLPVTLAYCYFGTGSMDYKILIIAMVAFYQLRMNVVLTSWYGATGAAKLKSVLPKSQIYFLPVILVNIFAWIYCLPFYWAADQQGALGNFEYIIIALYIVGTIWHFGSDYQKMKFKEKPENHGKLMNVGFWRFSRHPNYFGDFLIYLSFGLISGSIWGLVSPITNFMQYMFDAVPKNEEMSAERYGVAWEEYKARVKCLIPFVY